MIRGGIFFLGVEPSCGSRAWRNRGRGGLLNAEFDELHGLSFVGFVVF